MLARSEQGKSERLEAVVAMARDRVGREIREDVERFVREYFRDVDPEDFAERSRADLYGAALSHWNFARRREPRVPRLRVFNPEIEEHGWQSPHTIVEIVNDDMPFLVDSVTMEVNRHGLTLHLVIHPVVPARRDARGDLVELAQEPGQGVTRESIMHVEVDRMTDPARMEALQADIARVLADVRVAVEDWEKMTARAREIVDEFERRAPPIAAEELAEGKAFLAWLADNHFTFLGYRCHELVTVGGDDALQVMPGSGLGVLRESGQDKVSTSFAALPAPVRAYAREKDLLILTKSNSRSTVHRPGYLDYVGIKRYDERGEVCGEHRFLGLYTHSAYTANPAEIPLLRRKVANVVAGAGFPPGGHAAKRLENILDTYPRDELFMIGENELLDAALGILQLGERQRFRLFVRRDPFERFLSCLIYAPREKYNTELRRKWQAILTGAFNGTSSDFNVYLSESVLARILITVRAIPGSIPAYDVRDLEQRLAAAARRWEDDLKQALVERLGEARGSELYRRFVGAFPAAYREDFEARKAVPDVEMMARVAASGALGMSLYKPLEAPPGTMRFKLFRKGAPITLSDSMPMLERMGLRVLEERPYRIEAAGLLLSVHDFGLSTGADTDIEIEAVHQIFEEAFGRVFSGEIENDHFNRLVLAARLEADEIVVLRACARYLRQIGFPLSQSFIEATMAAHPRMARMLVELFRLRLDPEAADDAAAVRQVAAIEQALDSVDNLSQDRVLRQYLALILATTRTNYWRRDAAGNRRPFLSFKFDPSKVPGLPEPRPMFEIFVYSARFEGVHLRGGRVARGGLRWSDRPEDFRTEVLGLVKAQMVKNAVIVPVGSKGGFVLKRAPSAADRDALLKEGVACYQDYLRGLLDLTDNLVGGKVVPPPQVRRLDSDDPYLVVAADKGTAAFSDYANAISSEYGFWLDDAFASGGSAGYDHKAMGITARGAWESVKRHFREMDLDTQASDFTVVGIGDMSGDVFGNGMLLSGHIKLVAAFDHRHVFIDPDPDPAASFAERKRLFDLPRSSWADYDAALISTGGGVWPRTAKSIPLSPEARRVLGIETGGSEAASLAPNELIRAILKAPVDLLYNGGIGTYVKSSAESHAEVGDRANDPVRVDGRELRCKVVAEGGNLGFTQLGRIEYALAGGHINTDAIDNSAGVDTSDHEVNFKILLGLAIADGELTGKQRNALLAAMTGDVAALVLRDNYFQTQALSVNGRMAVPLLDGQQRFIQFLEKSGRLNRALEFLPSDEEIAERRVRRTGLTSPERAVLLAYSKLWLYDELLGSALPDDPWVASALSRYFPTALRETYVSYMPRHPLRREIIATYIVNSMVNRVGSTFVHRLTESTGARPHEVVRGYLLAREVFGFVPLWKSIEALDNKVADSVQARILIDAGRLIARATTWFLRSRRLNDDMGGTIVHFGSGVEALYARLDNLLDEAGKKEIAAQAARYTTQGVPAEIARRVVSYDTLYAALDIVEVADAAARPVETVAAAFFELSLRLGFAWLREKIGALPGESYWQTLARGAMRDDLSGLQRTLAANVLAGGDGADGTRLVAAWQERNGSAMERATRLLGEMRASPAPDLSMLSVALRELRNLA